MSSTAAVRTDAVIIQFPRPVVAPPTLAELSAASLLIEAHDSATSAPSAWQRHRWSSYCDGMATALSIFLAGECGDEQWEMKESLVAALNDGIDDPELLIAHARDPHRPGVA